MKMKPSASNILTRVAPMLLLLFGVTTSSPAFTFASYNAGSNGVPAVAPHPMSVEGGSWLNLATNATASFENIGLSPDPAYPSLNTWRILDNSTASGAQLLYAIFPTADQATKSWWCGFKMSAYLRVADPVAGNAGANAVVFQYGITNFGRRFLFFLDVDPSGALVASVVGSTAVTITTDPMAATNYHLHELIYDNATRTATYLVDGVPFVTNNPGATATTTAQHGTQWGTGSSGGRGDGYWNQVKVEINDLAPTTVTLSPTNVAKDVMESHTFYAAFTGCATNLQWYKGGSPIAGANQRSYTIANIVPSDGDVYKMGIADPQTGTEVFTDEATLTVNTDTTPPTVLSVQGLISLQHVRAKFSEGMDPTTAQNPANYQVVGGALTVSNATLVDLLTVDLLTSQQTANSNYSLIISGIQDLSGNTTLTTTQVFMAANLVPVAFYNAGTEGNPSVAPDPTLTNAGHWTFVRGTNELISATGVSPDGVTGFNAWNVTDHTTQSGQQAQYQWFYPKESHDFARTNGWRYRVRARFVDDFNTTTALLMLYADASGRRYLIFFDVAGIDLDLKAQLFGGVTTNLTSYGFGAFDYHTHDIVFDPVTQRASYYFDGNLIYKDWNGDTSTANNGPVFGSGSSAGMGSMNYNQVEFGVVDANTSLGIVTNPASTTVTAGAGVTFGGFASGFVGGYQWYKDGAPIAGATGKSYTIASATEANEGQYTFRGYNSAVEVESAAARLTILPTLSIARSNGNVIVAFTGTLQSATNVTDTFTDVTPAPTSPLVLTDPSGPSLFYRSRK